MRIQLPQHKPGHVLHQPVGEQKIYKEMEKAPKTHGKETNSSTI
jgi:hypothetical protein